MESVAYAPPSWCRGLLRVPVSRLRLVEPTPVESFVFRGKRLLVKRDDLAGARFYASGNKARKLELLAPQFAGHDVVITAGGTGSNSCRAVAGVCARLGVPCHLVLRMDADFERGDKRPQGNLLLARLLGCSVTLVTREQYRQLGQHELLRRAAQDYGRPYLLPVGCSVPEGVFGYVNFVEELVQQQRAADLRFNRIAFACGSGGTASGLAVAKALCPELEGVRIVGFTVCDTPDLFYEHVQGDLNALGLEGRSARDLIEFRCAKGLGYAVNSPEELALMKEVAACGLVLDGAYTLKAFKGMMEMLEGGGEETGTLFVHTGGLFSVFGMADLPTLQ